MDKLTNKELYDMLIKSMPSELGKSFPSYEEALSLNLVNINMNAFIDTLTNKIGKMLYIEQHFNNPFDILYAGEMPYGYSIEQLFLEDTEIVGILDKADEVFNSSLPRLKGIVSNSKLSKKAKVSISHERLKSAFVKEFGLYTLITSMLGNLKTSVSKDKFKEVEKTLSNFAKGLDYNEEKLNFKQKPCVIKKGNNLIETILETVEEFTLPNDKYNPCKTNTQCLKSDIVIFVKPNVYASLLSTYSGLLDGFYSIKSVKNLPNEVTNLTTNDSVEPLALIMDKRLIPIMLDYNGVEKIEDPSSLTINHYYYEVYDLPVNTFSNFAIISE